MGGDDGRARSEHFFCETRVDGRGKNRKHICGSCWENLSTQVDDFHRKIFDPLSERMLRSYINFPAANPIRSDNELENRAASIDYNNHQTMTV